MTKEPFRDPNFVSPRYYVLRDRLLKGDKLTPDQLKVIDKYRPIAHPDEVPSPEPEAFTPKVQASPDLSAELQAVISTVEAATAAIQEVSVTLSTIAGTCATLLERTLKEAQRFDYGRQRSEPRFLVSDGTGERPDQTLIGYPALEKRLNLKQSTMQVRFSVGQGKFQIKRGETYLTVTKIRS